MKPALARGELHCIGATTLDEYRKYVEKDAALQRRFQPVFVGEPTVEDTISILRGLKEKYELHHGVRITDGAIVAAATLSNRYITDRFLPDKAIDLMDEAASRLRMEVESKPEEIETLDRRIIQLKIEREALKKETDKASADRLATLEYDLAKLEEESAALTTRWQAEKDKIAGEAKLKAQLDEARIALDQAQRSGDLGRAGELSYGVIPTLEKQLAEAQAVSQARDAARGSDQRGHRRRRLRAGPASRSTGCSRASARSCSRWRRRLARRVIGQAEAVAAVSTRRPPRARRAAGSQPAARLLPVPRADRRRQDRAHQRARRFPVRRRLGDGPHRHERVHGEACRRPPDRRAAGLCRL